VAIDNSDRNISPSPRLECDLCKCRLMINTME